MATHFVQNYINQLMLEAYSPSRADIDFGPFGNPLRPWRPTDRPGDRVPGSGDYYPERGPFRNNPPTNPEPWEGPKPTEPDPDINPIVVPSPVPGDIGDPARPGYIPKPKPGRPWWYVPELLPAPNIPGSVPGSDTGNVPWWVLPFVAPFFLPGLNPALGSITPKSAESVGSKLPGTVG